MKATHNFICGKTIEILPCVDKNFPNHGAFITIRQEGKKEPIYMAMMRGYDEAKAYALRYGFNLPIGA